MGSPFNPYRQGGGQPRFVFGGGGLTPGIKGLIIDCVAMFLLQGLLPGWNLEGKLGLSAEGLIGDLHLWQPVTYLFLHSTSGILHLLFNMLMLWMFGTELERRWGTQAFLQYYLFCGVGAGLCSVAVTWLGGLLGASVNPAIATIGASGAVYGLLAAQAILFPDRMILLFLFFPIRMRPAVLLMAAITLWSSLSAPGSTINHVAHLGGMGLGWVYLHRAWNLRRLWHEWRWKSRRKRYRVVSDIRDDDRYRFH